MMISEKRNWKEYGRKWLSEKQTGKKMEGSGLVRNELERIWKEVAIALFKPGP